MKFIYPLSTKSIALCCFLLLLCGIAVPICAGEQPSVVVILCDDLGYGDLSCYGASLVSTPNIDRLAKTGRMFTDAHSPSSVCTPTRYGLLTGRYCWRTSLQREVLSPTAPLLIEPERMTLASLLKKQGYTTAAIGKWHLGYGSREKIDFNQPLQPGPRALGFDYHFGVPQNHGDFLRCYVENEQIIDRSDGEEFTPLGPDKLPRGLTKVRQDDEVDQVLTQKAVHWLDQQSSKQPFFLYFTPVAIHNPITPHAKFRGTSKCGLYGDYIHELDWSVGEILSALERKQLAENTLVIITSDNGGVAVTQEAREPLLTLATDPDHKVTNGARTAWRDALQAGHQSCGPWRSRKASIYEGGNRVPFIVRWPGHVPADSRCADLVCITDLLATLAKLTNVSLPENAGEDSYDISRCLLDERSAQPAREALVMHNVEGVFAIRRGPWKYVSVGAAPGAAKNSQFTKEGDVAQLYNLETDPTESNNVLAQHPQIGEELEMLLKRYRSQGFSRLTAVRTGQLSSKTKQSPESRGVCNRVRIYPATDAEQLLVGGRIEGSNISRHDGFRLLAEIKTVPDRGQWLELKFENQQVYRWLRYVGPPDSAAKLADIEFYSGERKLSSTGISYGKPTDIGALRKFAFDGDPKTLYTSSDEKSGYIGIDLRELATARMPTFHPSSTAQSSPTSSTVIMTHRIPMEVTLSTSTPNATIRYTLDGTWPSATNGQLYTQPLRIERTTTIQAVSFHPELAPSAPVAATYLMEGSYLPGLSTFHWGNSLTATTGMLAPFIRTAGYAHRSILFARPGALTKEIWDVGLVQEKERAMGLWNALERVDHVTVQPRDFNLAEEADYDIKFFNMAREKTPTVQPWFYCEWTELKRQRPTDRGVLPSRQMQKTFPALTWEESMGAMLLYMEDLQSQVCETYRDGNRPRVLPTALAMGWMKNMIDRNELPGVKPGSFYPLLFNDQMHPSVNPYNNEHANGGYLVDLTWFSAFYGESPEGKLLPIGTTFTPEQNQVLQRLAWDVIQNYPDCGLYQPGSTPCGKPEIEEHGDAIRLKSSTPGAWFRYTLDGTEPTRTRGYVYCGTITKQPGIQLKAIAYKHGMADSPVTSR